MIKPRFSVLFSVLFMLSLGAAGAGAQEFSADMVSHEGKQITNAKINVSGQKMRMEMPNMTMIIRNDKQVSWMIMPSEKMYMEHPIVKSREPKVSSHIDGETQREALGKEDVDGKSADKFKVTYTDAGTTQTVYQWLIGQIPVKIEAVDGSWGVEYKNLSTQPQDASLFEPPEGFGKMDMSGMGDMMKMGK